MAQLDETHAELGSALLVMAIIGGALVTPLMGLVSDAAGSVALSYAVPALCFGVVAAYGAAHAARWPAGWFVAAPRDEPLTRAVSSSAAAHELPDVATPPPSPPPPSPPPSPPPPSPTFGRLLALGGKRPSAASPLRPREHIRWLANLASAILRIGVISAARQLGWVARRWRRAVQRIRRPCFRLWTAHSLVARADGQRLLDEATALVEDHLSVAPGDHDESCDELPCGFVLLHEDADGVPHVAGYVRMATAPGAIGVGALQRMARMGMAGAARQRAMVAGMPSEVVEAILSGASPTPSASGASGASGHAQAYMGSLVVAPRFRGLGLGKALAARGAAHAAHIGCRQVVGTAATPALMPFYERLGAMAEHTLPREKRADMPKVKAAQSRELRVELEGFAPEEILGASVPPYVSLA